MTHPTHTIQETGYELMFVAFPKEASDLTLPKIGIVDLYFQNKNGIGEDYISVQIPQFDWVLIGISTELNESDLERVIPIAMGTYLDFVKDIYDLDTAIQSLHSLMDMMGLDKNEYWMVLKRRI